AGGTSVGVPRPEEIRMKYARTLALLLLAGLPLAAGATEPADHGEHRATHRYMVERTFPAGALEGVDAAAKASIIANNRKAGVRWETSFVDAGKTRTYCIYEAPDKQSSRKAAEINILPVDSITDIADTLSP